MSSRRDRPLQQHAAADLNAHFAGMAGDLNRARLRRCFVLVDDPPERRADVAIALTARRLLLTRFENGIDALAGAGPGRASAGERRRKDAVDGNRSNSAGMLAQVREREIGSVRYAVDVPFGDMQRDAQIVEVGG